MTATTDILQPTPTRGSVKKYSETQPEVAKCHSEHSEDPTGYPRTASEPSETPADPSAKASEPSEMPADPSATASEHSAALAEPSAGSSERSAGEECVKTASSDTLPRPLATPPNLGGELDTPHAEVTDSSPKLGANSAVEEALNVLPCRSEGSTVLCATEARRVPDRAEECVKTVSSNLEGQCKARTHNLSATKSLRRELRTHGTAAEATLWKMLKARQVMGKQFRRQFAVGAYVLDFYCPEARLAVELDGQPHYTIEGDLHDTDRDEYLLATHGIRTLRFENSDVFRNPEGVLEAIKEALTHSSANGFTHSANGFTHSSAFGTSSNLEEESVTPHAEVFSNSSPKLGEVPVGGRSVSNRRAEECVKTAPSDTLPRPLATPPNLGGELNTPHAETNK